MKRSLILFLALSTIPALAQQAPKPPNPAPTSAQPKPPSAPVPSAVPDGAAPTLPTLTELQKAKLENLQLKFTLLQQQQTQLQGEYQTLVQTIVAEHPGFRWDAQSSSLVAVPAAPKK